MNLEHVALNVPEPAKAAQWYAEHLGLKIVKASSESPFIHFLAGDSGQGLIEMYNNPLAVVPDYGTQSPFILHLAFSVEDIEATRAKLITAGATAEGEIDNTPVGDQLAIVRDPWGVCLQLVKRGRPLVG